MKPFDLEAAKSGAPIITRDGREARFIAHVQDAEEDSQLIWLDIQNKSIIHSYANGKYVPSASEDDLFMKPQKRTVWANLYTINGESRFARYEREEDAKSIAGQMIGSKLIAIAVPIEIEE